MKVVVFFDECIELDGTMDQAKNYVTQKINDGYDIDKFFVYEKDNTLNSIDEYFEHGTEYDIEDLVYAHEYE